MSPPGAGEEGAAGPAGGREITRVLEAWRAPTPEQDAKLAELPGQTKVLRPVWHPLLFVVVDHFVDEHEVADDRDVGHQRLQEGEARQTTDAGYLSRLPFFSGRASDFSFRFWARTAERDLPPAAARLDLGMTVHFPFAGELGQARDWTAATL